MTLTVRQASEVEWQSFRAQVSRLLEELDHFEPEAQRQDDQPQIKKQSKLHLKRLIALERAFAVRELQPVQPLAWAFGEILSEELALEWVVVLEAEGETEWALKVPEIPEVLLFPLRMVKSQLEHEGAWKPLWLFETTKDYLRGLRRFYPSAG